MSIRRHALRGLLAVAAITTALLAAPTLSSAENAVLRVGVQPTLNDIWAGVAADTFSKHGLKLEYQTFTSGAAMFAALQGGAIDMGIGGMATFYVARSNGQDIRWIATTGMLGDSDACMVGPASDVNEVADLKGKNIGFFHNTVVHAPLIEMLEANGVSVDDVELLNLQPPVATAALLNGDIDMACVWGPFTFQIEDQGGRRLFSMTDTPSGGVSVSGYAVSRTWAEENPQGVIAFLKGLKEGQEAYARDPQPALEAVSEATGLDIALAARQAQEIKWFPVEDSVRAGSPTTMCNAADGEGVGGVLDRASKFFIEVGTLSEVLPFDEFLEPKYAAEAFGTTCSVEQ